MKTVLAFETSHPILSVALGTADGRVEELKVKRPFQHSELLIPLVRKLLQKNRLRFEQLDALALDRGPGSFTGLRIGFSLMKGFLVVRKRPCYGALSLDMIADGGFPAENSKLAVLIDARRERIYTRFYRSQKGIWRPEKKMELLTLSELENRLTKVIFPSPYPSPPEGERDRVRGRVSLAGDGLLRYRKPLEEIFGPRLYFLDEKFFYPKASTLVEWFQKKDPRLVRLKAPGDFLPLYFRASEAEEKKKEARKLHGG